MVHFKFGARAENAWSFGLEASYWSRRHLPLGLDAGFEYDTRGLGRLYAEGELGIGLAGAAFGPVAEIGRGFRLGMQGSVWANYFLGTDCRVRKLWGARLERAAGAYLKIPAHAPDEGDGPVY
jgi:hypothetical protein